MTAPASETTDTVPDPLVGDEVEALAAAIGAYSYPNVGVTVRALMLEAAEARGWIDAEDLVDGLLLQATELALTSQTEESARLRERVAELESAREAAALHGYETAIRDATMFRVKIAEPFDTAFETNKQFVLDMLNRNLRQMRARSQPGGSHD